MLLRDGASGWRVALAPSVAPRRRSEGEAEEDGPRSILQDVVGQHLALPEDLTELQAKCSSTLPVFEPAAGDEREVHLVERNAHAGRVVTADLDHLTWNLRLKLAANVERRRAAAEQYRVEPPTPDGDREPGEHRYLEVHELRADAHGHVAHDRGESAAPLGEEQLELGLERS